MEQLSITLNDLLDLLDKSTENDICDQLTEYFTNRKGCCVSGWAWGNPKTKIKFEID